MNELISFLLFLIVLLLLIFILFFVYLLFYGKKREQFELNKDHYIKNNELDWYLFLTGQEKQLNHKLTYEQYEVEAIEEMLISYTRNASDKNILFNIQKFTSENLLSFYRQQLKSSKWSIRMNALYRIGDFKMKDLFEDCKKMLRKKVSKEEYFEIMILCSYFDISYFIEELIAAKMVFSEYEYKKIFFGISDQSESELEKQFEKLPLTTQLAYIDTLGLKRKAKSLVFLEKQSENEQPEIRIRSLKAAYEIGIPIEVEKLESFIASPIWEERLMSVRLLSILPSEDSLAHLRTLIEDQNWWVRSKAAEVIRQGKNGKAVLKEIVQFSKDAYAVDIANELLNEKG